MKLYLKDVLLIGLILLGGILALRTGSERRRLEAEVERLFRASGDLPVGDESRVHVLALKTGEPLHFAWRVYVPPNYKQIITGRGGGGSWSGSSSSSSAQQFTARVRFREDPDGALQVYSRFSGGSSLMSIGDRPLATFLRDRWNRLRVEQLGAAHLETVPVDGSAVLLRLTLPDDMREEFKQKLPTHPQSRYVPVLYELRLGPNSSEP
jgi:hypothetical protein